MTVKADAAAAQAAITAVAKATSVARGAHFDSLMTSVQLSATELQRKVVEVLKLHPPVTRSVTVGGTAHAGDTLNIAVTPVFGAAVTASYTLTAGDTLATAAASLLAQVNLGPAAPVLSNATITATGLSGAVFNLQYNVAPSALTVSVTGTGATTTLTLGAVTGSTDATNLNSLNTLLGELL
jgi:hypothetical protein